MSPGLCAGLLQPDGLRVSTPRTSEPPAWIFKESQGPGRDRQVCGARRGEPSLLTLTGRVLCSGEGTLSTPETRHHQPAALVTEDAVTSTRHRHRPRVKNHRHLGPAPQGPWAVSPRDQTGVPRIRPHPEKWLGRQGKPSAGTGGAGPRLSPWRPALRRARGQTSDCAPAPSVSRRARRQQTRGCDRRRRHGVGASPGHTRPQSALQRAAVVSRASAGARQARQPPSPTGCAGDPPCPVSVSGPVSRAARRRLLSVGYVLFTGSKRASQDEAGR